MNDIFESPAFQEFLQKRAEEILLNDKGFKEINQTLLNLEDEFCAILSSEAMDKFIHLQSITAELLAHIEPLLYLKGKTDSAFLR